MIARYCAGLLILWCLTSCTPSYEKLDFERVVVDAEILFSLYSDKETEFGRLDKLPDSVPYLRSLDPKRFFINNDQLYLTLKISGVESYGIVVLREGEGLKNVMGVDYKKLSANVYQWENRG